MKRLIQNCQSLQNVNFGALLLNYFGFQNEDNLKEILQYIPIDSIINYLNAIFIKARTVPDEVDLMKVLFKMNIFWHQTNVPYYSFHPPFFTISANGI